MRRIETNKLCGQRQTDNIVDCVGKCVSYLNEDDNGKEKKTFLLIPLKLIYNILK